MSPKGETEVRPNRDPALAPIVSRAIGREVEVDFQPEILAGIVCAAVNVRSQLSKLGFVVNKIWLVKGA